MDNLEKTISELIRLKKEGGFWDYKSDYSDNKASFLHDIICMANNLENRDAYLIYGVDDDGKVNGIQNSTCRKSQSNIINFLKNKKFFGDNRPDIELATLKLGNDEIDVLIIKNTTRTPYLLHEDFSDRGKTVKAGFIYTRIGDNNTDIINMADNDKVEYLWKKRFGIEKSIVERLNMYLEDWQNWGIYKYGYLNDQFIQGGDFGNDNYIYYKYFPEFRIEVLTETEQVWEKETMRCFYCNQTAGHYIAKIFYNSTELFSFYIAHVDEYRKYLVLPKTDRLVYNENSIYFYYMIEDEVVGRIQKIITNGTFSTVSRGLSADKYWLLLFETREDFDHFIEFANNNIDKFYNSELKNGEYGIGDEKNGAHVPMKDTHKAYRIYVEYQIQVKKKDRSLFDDYFNWYNHLSKTEN